jgi:hypothetical protein
VLLIGLVACTLTKSDLIALEFTVERFLMKLFKSVCMELINECRIMFRVKLPSESIAESTKKLICNLLSCDKLTYQTVGRLKLTVSVYMHVCERAYACFSVI